MTTRFLLTMCFGAAAISPLSAQKPQPSGPPRIGTFVSGNYNFTTKGYVKYSMHDGDPESLRKTGTYKDDTWIEKSEDSDWKLTFSYSGSTPHLHVDVKSWMNKTVHTQTGATHGVKYRIETTETETLSSAAHQPSMDYNATLQIAGVKSPIGMHTYPALVMSLDPTFAVDFEKVVESSYAKPDKSTKYYEKNMHFNLRNWTTADWERGVLDTMNDHSEYQADDKPWLNIHATWQIQPR